MESNFLQFLGNSDNDHEKALCIDDEFFTYRDLKFRTAKIVAHLTKLGYQQQSIAVLLDDNIDTYAALLAIWYTGNIYIPIHPSYPPSRVKTIIQSANVKLIFSSEENESSPLLISYNSLKETESKELNEPYRYTQKDIVYILFTSGSTGVPKGVQINYSNISSFIQHLDVLNLGLNKQAGYLQMFEMTFDLSVVSILLPFINTGTLYHVSSKSVKYLEIYRLLEDYQIEFAIIVPSVLAMLRPYFSSIELPNLKAVGLSGEAVPLDLTKEWQVCCSNAKFFNFYGPTECTIFCTYYEIPKDDIAALNGIVSIGKVNNNCLALCLKEDGTTAQEGEKSLLWIGGEQVSPGYLNNEELNQSLFIIRDGIRYYNTGDVVIKNEKEEFFYLGRKDHQVKISGYRIELSEVEYNATRSLNTKSIVIATEDKKGMMQLVLFVVKTGLTNADLLEKLKQSMPGYMVPTVILQVDEFPLNDNGKLDRKQLKEYYDQQR
jgi:amino acid adenylation domain-containing protein